MNPQCKDCKNIERSELEIVSVMTQLQTERRKREALVDYLRQPWATIEGARRLL